MITNAFPATTNFAIQGVQSLLTIAFPRLACAAITMAESVLAHYRMCNSRFAAGAIGVTAIAMRVSKHDGGLRQSV